ncbi:MAG: hypothetical protein ABI488_09855 [Polyangiaceae bacterium]
MRSLIAVLIAVAAASLSVGACSSDGPGVVVDTAQCVGVYSDLSQTTYNRSSQPDLGCSSDDDLTNTCTNDLTTIAGTCGRSCLSVAAQDAAAACAANCINNNLPSPFSESCMDCYTADIYCARTLCLGSCLSPTSKACATCRVEKGCASSFYGCSGLPVPSGLDLGTGEGGGGAIDGAAAGAGGAGADETPAAGAGGS